MILMSLISPIVEINKWCHNIIGWQRKTYLDLQGIKIKKKIIILLIYKLVLAGDPMSLKNGRANIYICINVNMQMMAYVS